MSLENLPRKEKALILTGVSVGILLASLASNIVGTALPKIISSLNGFNLYTWPITAYLLCMTVAIPLAGKLADIFGFKPVYILGIIIFLAGSVLCGFSPSMIAFIAFRGVQGIGAAVLMTNSLAIVNLLFVPAERAKFGGIVSLASGFASAIGPVLGGVIVDHMSWRWVFFINLPIGLLAMLVISFAFPQRREKQERPTGRMDIGGALILVAAMASLLLGLSLGGSRYPWGSLPILIMLTFSAVALILFAVVESRARDPIIPLSLFKNSIFNASALEMFLFNGVLMAILIFVPLSMQGAKGSSASESGAVITPMSVLIIAGVIAVGPIIAKTGRYKALAVLGFLLMCAGTLALTLAGRDTGSAVITGALVLTGLGIGVEMVIFNVTAQNVTKEEQMGVVTAGIQFFRMVGQTIVSSVMGTIFGNALAGSLRGLDTGGLPASLAAQLRNPDILSNATALESVRKGVPADLLPRFGRTLEVARTDFAAAIRVVLGICLVICVMCLVVSLVMKEVPLRKKAEAAKQVRPIR